jgi:iron complex outermembrane receptor protein
MAKQRAHLGWLGLFLGLGLGGLPAAFALDPSPGGGAGASSVQLAPVVVPLPPDAPPSDSPSRRDPSGSLSLVDAREHQGEAKDVAALLAGAPGLVISDSGGVGQAKSLSIRGASSSGVLVLLDGVPLNAAGGSVDLSRIPVAIIDRLEVLRGGAGARYGSGGLGGAVNVVTRKAEAGARLFAEVTQGSAMTTLADLGAAGDLAGGQGLLLVHGARSEGTFTYQVDPRPTVDGSPLVTATRENNQALMGGALFKLRRALPLSVTADATAELSAESRGLAGTAQNPTPNAHQTSDRGAVGLRLTRPLDQGEAEAHLWLRREDLALHGGGFGAGLTQAELSGGGELTFTRLVAGWHGLSATVAAKGESLRESTGANPSRASLSVMASDEVLLLDGNLIVAPSFRFDQTGPFTGVSPKLGLTALLPGGFEFRANAGQAHRAPSFLELYVQQGFLLPNASLRPERALTADASAAHRTARSFVQAGGFVSLYEDLISYEYYPPMLARPYNFSTAQVAGLEAEGEARPWPWLSVAASYTFLVSQNLRDDPRYYLKELPYRPRHKLAARVAAGPKWARGRAELLYQSEQAMNRTQTLFLPARALVNVGVSSELLAAPQLTASLEVKNLLDVSSEDLAGYPLPGRSAYLTLAMSWDVRPKP